jgi:hypothetical protein
VGRDKNTDLDEVGHGDWNGLDGTLQIRHCVAIFSFFVKDHQTLHLNIKVARNEKRQWVKHEYNQKVSFGNDHSASIATSTQEIVWPPTFFFISVWFADELIRHYKS